MKHKGYLQGKLGIFAWGRICFCLVAVMFVCFPCLAIDAPQSGSLWEKDSTRSDYVVSKTEYRDAELELIYESSEEIVLYLKGAVLSLPATKASSPLPVVRVRMVGSRAWVWVGGNPSVIGCLLLNPESFDQPLPPAGKIHLPEDGKNIRWQKCFTRPITSEEASQFLRSLRNNEDFSPVFNGRNLDGWTGALDSVRVEDGAIAWQPKKGGVIFTKREYSDFIVGLEFKLPPGGNNGLAIRYPGKGDPAYAGMCESQVLDDNYEKVRNQRIDARQAHGSAYGIAAAKRGYQRPVGEWNYQEVSVIGSTIKVELNGTVILDADLAKVTRYQDNKAHPGKNRKHGHFGLAGHNDPVMFRNITLKTLDTASSVP